MEKSPCSQKWKSPHTPLSASFTSVVSYHSNWNISADAETLSIEKAWIEGKWPEVVSVAKNILQTASCTPVNIAVTGDSGNGMSTFINALRGIGHEEEASAPTGVVRTTHIPTSYSSSSFPNVVLWDLPGMGATNQSLENYLQEIQFHQYDLFIIIASEQFSLNHVRLTKTIEGKGKKFYIVWTKLDRDLSMSSLQEVQLQQTIRKNILENLQKEQLCEPPIFLVSNLDPSWYDFPKLRDTLQKDLSHIRCHGTLQNLSRTCEKIINDKVNFLLEKIDTQTFQDALGISNADDWEECLQVYLLHFGVDDESLQQVALRMERAFLEYKSIMKSQDLQAFSKGDWKLTWMNCAVFQAFVSFLSYIPLLGHHVIHYFRRFKHKRFIAMVAEDTRVILSQVWKDSII
ncbi:immunity-related GTPase family M protein 1-like [Dasypus novemcinctus]|uniref:immunity-related GTPase family M protein 1-like n=1 Tax=Dasypus novemcinctus TaxID=9361 RepID=UPI00032917DF|nr:immunity-related GTPase family M protein 1-like [Dasypus novemcinctus]